MKKEKDKKSDCAKATSIDGESEAEEENKEETGADDLAPYEEKRGERPDNLRQRSDWFQKRTGKR